LNRNKPEALMSPANDRPDPEIIPPGQSHGFTDKGAQKHAFDGFDDLGDQMAGALRHPMATPRVSYVLYALSVVSGVPMLVGLIVAYVARGDAPVWLQSHYTFLIRTFWYFIALVIIGFVLAFFLIGFMLLWVLPLWVAIRVVRGWLLLENRKAVPNPESWLFG